jgi:hypothetical protein
VKTRTVSDLQAHCSDWTKEDREIDGVGLKRSSLPMSCVCVTAGEHECAVMKLICFVLSVDFAKEPQWLWPGVLLMETVLQRVAGYHRPRCATL